MEKIADAGGGQKRNREKKTAMEGKSSFPQSKLSEEDLKVLVENYLLQPKELVHWRSSLGESSPSPKDSEVILFTPFVKYGLALPACDFLQGVLYYHGIQIHHLTPESILHLSIFVHLCEAFLGIEPHFELFRKLYSLVPRPSRKEMGSFGCANLELRSEVVDKYLEWPRIHIDPSWSSQWFYIHNQAPSLAKFSADPPVYV